LMAVVTGICIWSMKGGLSAIFGGDVEQKWLSLMSPVTFFSADYF
jgi:hypothetical protein